jgi:nicotinamidase-related amidase
MSRHARAPIPPETTVLVVVHLSSILNYADVYGVRATQRLASDLIHAIESHNGPVVVMDQEWRTDMSGDVRRQYDAIREAGARRDALLFHHDEMSDRNPWTDGMDELARILRQLKARKVLVCGLWLSAASGCVRYTRQSLTWRRISSRIVEEWSAFEENDPRAA